MSADWLLTGVAGFVAVPFAVLALESLLAVLPRRPRPAPATRPACAVLVPAHDEELGVGDVVRAALAQTRPGDRLVVVADNCTDGTADAARAAGAEVLVRTDPERRGKGFALDFGLKHLAADPPPVVAVLDADCRGEPGALDRIVADAAAFGTAVQGIYLIGTGREGDLKRRLSAWAVAFKNQVRPLGLSRLGSPCLLTGTGMAFPWSAVAEAHLGTGNIVEDMKLGVDLAAAGFPPRLCADAVFRGDAAPDKRSALKQRTRWEQGHVRTLLTQVPRLALTGISRLRPGLLGLALELGVPPLSLLVVLWAGVLTGCLVWWQWGGGSAVPAGILTVVPAATALTMLTAWVRFGRNIVTGVELLSAPVYVLWKVPIYLKLLVAPERAWVRTERKTSG